MKFFCEIHGTSDQVEPCCVDAECPEFSAFDLERD